MPTDSLEFGGKANHRSQFAEMRIPLRTAIVLFWLVLSVLLGINTYAAKDITESGWFNITSKILLNISVALWLLADGRARLVSEERLRWYLPFSILLTELTIPVYVVKTRGWKGAVIASLRFVGYLAIWAIIMAVTIVALKAFDIHKAL